MIRSKKGKAGLFVFLSLILSLIGCQSEKNSTGDNNTGSAITYRDHLTEQEKADGRASFVLMENISVDANVTPADKYKDGLADYYMEHYYEAREKEPKEDFVKNPHLFGRKYPEFQKLVSEEMKGAFTGKLKINSDGDGLLLLQDFKKQNGTKCQLQVELFEEEEWKGGETRLNCPCVFVERQDERMMPSGALPHDVKIYVKDYQKLNVSFLKDNRDTGKHLKKFLENLTNRKLSDTWECVPVTSESAGKIAEGGGSEPGIEPDKEYCIYHFYADVAGFPYVSNGSLTYKLKDGEKASPEAKLGALSDSSQELMALNENTQKIVVSEDGIEGIETSHVRDAGDVYKEASAVADPDGILQNIKDYYEHKLIQHPVTITDITLVYTGYFSDDSEGEIRPTVTPFWRVVAYDGTSTGSIQFIYNAFTGEPVAEGASM